MNLPTKLMSEIVFNKNYARHLAHLGRRETLQETINRNMNMHLNAFPDYSKDIIKAYGKVHNLEVVPSMRALQFSGEAILKNNCRQYNCSFLHMNDARSFGETLFLLLSGVGVGFSVQSRHVNQLPKIQKPREEGFFFAHDSISGWAQCVDLLMDAYFFGRIRPNFDFGAIRPKGSYLVTTGAKAPGSVPLKKMLEMVEEKLKAAIGRKLKPIEVHDIVCIISDCVLAGGIRRSALLSLFDRNDIEMLKCKHGEWWNSNPWRARANNSVVMPRGEVTREEFDYLFKMCKDSNAGEPGFSWTNNSDLGFNPCQPAFAKLMLASGVEKTMGELQVGDILLNCKNEETVVLKKWSTGIKRVYAYSFNSGTFIGTMNHRMVTETGKKEIEMCFIDHEPVLTVNGLQTTQESIYLGDYEVFDITVSDETHTYLTNGIYVSNCHEISLNSNQFCNLTTINQTGIKSEKDFLNRVYAATLIGTLQATYTDFPYLRPIWKETTEKEALLGISFTGIADSGGVVTDELLRKGAKLALEVNQKYAKKLGINPAARVTTVKPEGSSSCVLGSSSGIHARHAQYYLRRLRMNKNDALAGYLSETIPSLVEDDKFSSTGIVVTIPQESPQNAIIRANETALTLFERVIKYNKEWIMNGYRSGDNQHNVSATISVKENEWDSLREAMWNERYNYCGVSLLPYDLGSYIQPPFEDCTKEKYDELSLLIKEIDLKLVIEEQDNTNLTESLACSGGQCEIVQLNT